MSLQFKTRLAASLLAAVFSMAGAQPAQPGLAGPGERWAATWIAPAQPLWGPDFALPLGMPAQLENTTIRQSLRVSVGGERIRLVVDNRYGSEPLKVGRVQVAHEGSPAGVPVHFHGRQEVLVGAGAQAVSDPVELPVSATTRLQVDLYLPQRTPLAGFHWDARDSTLLLPGDRVGQAATPDAKALTTRAFLSSVMVQTRREPVAVVALGDSITDGNGATTGADHRWPDFLARRLAPQGVAVLNAGISGNRLLRPGMGESGLARLEKDVLAQPGVRSLIVLLGTNDIGWPGGPFAPGDAPPSTGEMAQGFRQLVTQARLRGVRVVGATIPPFEDALKGTPLEGHYSPQKESARQALNAWIRNAGAFDAVVDFDLLLRDTSRPQRLRPEYDSGDHLHPNDAGYLAMAQAVDAHALLELASSARDR